MLYIINLLLYNKIGVQTENLTGIIWSDSTSKT